MAAGGAGSGRRGGDEERLRGGDGIHGVGDGADGGGALGGVFIEATNNELRDGLGGVAFDLFFAQARGDGLGRHGLDLVAEIAGVEGGLAGEQFVKGGAEGVEVIGHGGGFAVHLLGAHKGDGAAGVALAEEFHVGIGEGGGDAEVGELHAAGEVDENVGGLEVAMDELRAVGVIERTAKLEQDGAQFGPAINFIFFLLAQSMEGRAFDKFHYQKRRFGWAFVDVVKLDDVLVGEPAVGGGFLAQLGDEGGVLREVGLEELERHGVAKAFIAREPHAASATGGEHPAQRVAPGAHELAGDQFGRLRGIRRLRRGGVHGEVLFEDCLFANLFAKKKGR